MVCDQRVLRWLVVLVVACGPKVAPAPWTEHEIHEVHAAPHAAAPTSVDLTKLDASTIDELDEATAKGALDQLGDRAPAARVALRAARLAHHRGDDADARALVARAASA